MERRELLKSAAVLPLAALPALPVPASPPPPRLDIRAGAGDDMVAAWHKTASWLVWLEENRERPEFDEAYRTFKADMEHFRGCVLWYLEPR